MTGLDADLVATGPAIAPDPPDAIEVAVDPVDADAVDHEPGTAVDPRAPAARLEHAEHAIGDRGGQRAQRIDVEPAAVVQAEIDIRIGPVGPDRAAAAQHRGDHAANFDEPARQRHDARGD